MTEGTNNQLKAYVERIERLDDAIYNLQGDRKEVFAEAKGNGFDVAALRLVLKDRKIAADAAKKAKADEVNAIAEAYRHQLGLFD